MSLTPNHLFFSFCLLLFSSALQATTYELRQDNAVIGHNMIVYSRAEDTLLDIARRFNLGYGDIINANPEVDRWLPGEGTRVILPTRYLIPEAEREGIVINTAELRLFYFPKPAKGESAKVITHPIGIGREGWATPLGKGHITQKVKDPTWTPPESIRQEHLEKGDVLPKVVPAGPDNPLGAYKMNLSIPGYLLHGTNKPYGVGMRVSHGCIRLFPEDIESLFATTPVRTQVNIIYQPDKAVIQEGKLYLESHQVQTDIDERQGNNMTPMVSAIIKAQDTPLTDEEWPFVETVVRTHSGVVVEMHETDMDIIEDIWFLHPGFDENEVSKVREVMSQSNSLDLFWPISAGANGELLIGPFNSKEEADLKAEALSKLAATALWVVQVADDAL